MPYTAHQTRFFAEQLMLKRPQHSLDGLASAMSGVKVDLNPHQVDAALFALQSPLSSGALLADEVGLGKTIEAGLVLAQYWSERKRKILLIVTASLRTQWRSELEEKFFIRSEILESKNYNKAKKEDPSCNPFLVQDAVVICSYNFASAKMHEVRSVDWDLIIMDEAHKLRNVYKRNNVMGNNLKIALAGRKKLLLTATPLQNNLMELYGLVSIIDERVFGDSDVFREVYVNVSNIETRNRNLKARLQNCCKRTLRRQVTEYVSYTERRAIMQEYTPSPEEEQLYTDVSNYLQRERLYAFPQGQRQLLMLVARKLLASSSMAIHGTLSTIVERLNLKLTDYQTQLNLSDLDDYDGIEELIDEESNGDDAGAVEAMTADYEGIKEEIEELKRYDEETDDYHREPFAADVSEGKSDPIYKAHAYHTKVPYKAIMRYILHYTEPGDIVLDGFCGSGMTGVAAQMCGAPDNETKAIFDADMQGIKWGKRNAIICDLSPAATYISYSYNQKSDIDAFQKDTEKLLRECEKEFGWMYETQHTQDGHAILGLNGLPIKGMINYTIWSDVFVCPSCSKEIVFWDNGVDIERGKVLNTFSCPHCSSQLSKRDCVRVQETYYDNILKKIVTTAKQVPVYINYSVGKRRYEKKPDAFDLSLIKKINEMEIPYWVPTSELPVGYNTEQPKKSHGITNIHQFYTKRTLAYLAALFAHAKSSEQYIILTKIAMRLTKLYRLTYMNGCWGAGGGPMGGTLYISSLVKEISVLKQLKENIKDVLTIKSAAKSYSCITTQSTTSLKQIPPNCVDYIFTDPPFGSNLNYSELSFIWEAWLSVYTDNHKEAIINPVQNKALADYQRLMEQCFCEYFKVLKPGRWITVEFHNSQNSVWNSIQEALLRAGFVVCDVRTLDKKQSSFKQTTSVAAVKQDLVISAYKPKESFIRQFSERAGDPEMAWEFVRQHLQNVPIAPDSSGEIEVVSERQDYLLFDRMVAFHIMNGIPVPVDAHTFYAGLRERFIQRDGMFFLPDQVNEYDERRQKMELQDQQLSLFITDEKSAIIWLNAQLGKERQSYSEIQPKFLQDWHRNKFEQMPELLDMLKENFLQDEDGKWYVPDLSDKADLEKLRRKRLLKDFYDIYAKGTGRIKNARTEAIRVGFDECWKERNYSLIVKVGDRLPETVLQEDPALLMYYDNAANRM